MKHKQRQGVHPRLGGLTEYNEGEMETVTQYTRLAMLISGPRYPHISETYKQEKESRERL